MIIFIPFGIIASILQLVILREFSFSIARHELAFVLAAGFWIISFALGSLIKLPGKRISSWLLPLSSASFSASICLIHLAKSLMGIKYFQTPSPQIVALTLALVGLPALIMGTTFHWLLQRLTEESPAPTEKEPVKFLAFEAAGFFLGGVIFTFLLKDYTNPLTFSWLPLLLLPGLKERFSKVLSICLIATITLVSIINFNLIIKKEFDGSQILVNRGSRYGPVIIATKSGVTNFFSQGTLLATSEDKLATEEFIHLSLSATKPAVNKDILFIGAALSGQIEELSKYKLSSLDCLQINPLLWEFTPAPAESRLSGKINFITADPRAYLKKTTKKYDAVLMNMPGPTSLALNRYFTEDFFKLVIRCLKPQGIFSFSMPSKREILSPQFVKFNSSIINALDRVFPARLTIPSDSMVVIASSGGEISDQYLLNNFMAVKPQTEFFTIYHFRDYLDPEIRNYIQKMLNKSITPNSDLYPSGFLTYLILEQAKFYPNLKIELKVLQKSIILLLWLCGLAGIISCRFPKICCLLNIGTVGFTSISLTSIIFILFQLYCAALFWKLGLLIALFMAGMVIGIYLLGKAGKAKADFLPGIYLGWTIVSFALLFHLKGIAAMNNPEFIFYLSALSCGILTGCTYPAQAENLISNKFNRRKVPGIIYAVDLSGAFLGALVSGILLIPFLGIPESLLVIIFLNAIFALINLGC